MKHLLILILFVAIGCSESPPEIEMPPQQRSSFTAPSVPDACLFRPTFETDLGSVTAGTAFPVLLSSSQGHVLVSALHLLGPSGGLSEDIPPEKVRTSVDSIVLSDLFEEGQLLEFKANVIEILETAPMGEVSKYGDVVVFSLPNEVDVNPFEFASSLPKINDPVWLAAQLVDGAPESKKLHRGIFLGVDEEQDLIVRFDNPKLELRATSGAPIVDSNGKVIAINLGGWTDAGIVYGVGNPITRFLRALDTAIQN